MNICEYGKSNTFILHMSSTYIIVFNANCNNK